MSRIFHHGSRFLATLFGILALLVMIASWRLAYVPVHSTSLTPYIEKALSRVIPGGVAQVGQSTLIWDNTKQTLTLSCSDIRFTSESGAELAIFQTAQFKLRLWHLLSGGVLPQEFVVEHAKLSLVRGENGLISFGTPQAQVVQEKSRVKQALDFTLLQFVADEISNPRLKHSIAISDVVVSVRDERFDEDWVVTIPDIHLSHNKIVATGEAKVELKENDRTAALQLLYAFEPSSKLHKLTLNFQDIKPSAFAAQNSHLALLKIAEFPISGHVALSTDRELNIAKVDVNLNGGKGTLADSTLWDKPRSLHSLIVQANYDKDKDTLQVSKAEIDFGGPRLNLTLDAKIPPPKDLIWLSRKNGNNAFTLRIALDDLPMDEFGSVWPKTIIPDARNWMVNSLSKGIYTHGDVTIHGKANLKDLEHVVLDSGGGKVYAKGGTVNYLAGMPNVENANAEATFDLDHMDVTILSGNTGAIKIQPFTLVMNKFQEDIQHIMIPIKLIGPVKDVLKVLDSPPLGYAKAIGLSAEDSSGLVEGTLTLRMPLLDALLLKDIDLNAQAKITSFAAQKLVPGITITQGNLALDLTQDGFNLKGTAALNNVVSQIVWDSVFDTVKTKKPLHKATITANLKGNEWNAFYGLGSLAKIDGETPTTIKYTNVRAGFSKVSGQVGLKQASVRMKDIGWNKPIGEAAQLTFALDIPSHENMVFRTIELQGPGIKVKGNAELDSESGKLLSMAFKPFILGRSNATISYIRPLDVTKPLSVSIMGESFDMNGIDEMEKEDEAKDGGAAKHDTANNPESKRPKDYKIQLVKLYTSEDGFMASMKGHALRDDIGWKDIDLWGVAQGSTPVSIKLGPDHDYLALKIEADNFGRALQGLGFGGGIKGGKIEIKGESSSADPRTINGKIKIDSFVVTDLPVLARLLSAVSPFGFMDLITGEASFDRFLAHYKWRGNDVDLSEVRAAGSVVGINLSGRLNIESGEGNLSGTLVPFSFMNSIIGSIPLLGDVITGGSGGGIIAASFTMKGPLSNPNISVNPVSLLTPGILRSLFFSNGDTSGSVENESDMDNPKAALPPASVAPKSGASSAKSNLKKK
ncbi:MAG: DUF3971 domain-containing protein [Alphaproteobacteria bacterium]|nr:DUF3971 domain-containing protein [Alphaproteobacteria bacterium]